MNNDGIVQGSSKTRGSSKSALRRWVTLFTRTATMLLCRWIDYGDRGRWVSTSTDNRFRRKLLDLYLRIPEPLRMHMHTRAVYRTGANKNYGKRNAKPIARNFIPSPL